MGQWALCREAESCGICSNAWRHRYEEKVAEISVASLHLSSLRCNEVGRCELTDVVPALLLRACFAAAGRSISNPTSLALMISWLAPVPCLNSWPTATPATQTGRSMELPRIDVVDSVTAYPSGNPCHCHRHPHRFLRNPLAPNQSVDNAILHLDQDHQ